MEFKFGTEQVNVACTWGDGPDVILHVHRSEKHIKSWKPDFVPLDLTAEQAIQLGHHLIMSGKQAQELDQLCTDHDEFVEKQDEIQRNSI